eukprot:2343361-Pyramimonas_sp.AAC.1
MDYKGPLVSLSTVILRDKRVNISRSFSTAPCTEETVKDFDACGLTLVYAKVRIVFAADVGPEKPHLKLNLQRSERPRGKRGPLLTEGMFQRLLESALRRLSSDPVTTPEGCIYSKEAILECLVSQKKTIARQLAAWEGQETSKVADFAASAHVESNPQAVRFPNVCFHSRQSGYSAYLRFLRTRQAQQTELEKQEAKLVAFHRQNHSAGKWEDLNKAEDRTSEGGATTATVRAVTACPSVSSLHPEYVDFAFVL